jgi:hypothetical protein
LIDLRRVAYGGHGPTLKMDSEVDPGRVALTTSAVPKVPAIGCDALLRRLDVSSEEDSHIVVRVVRHA